MKTCEARDEVLANYNYRCAKCGKEETRKDKLTLHHIIFKFWYRSHGLEVDNSPENLAPLHRSCHTKYHEEYNREHQVSRMPRTNPESLRQSFREWRDNTGITLPFGKRNNR